MDIKIEKGNMICLKGCKKHIEELKFINNEMESICNANRTHHKSDVDTLKKQISLLDDLIIKLNKEIAGKDTFIKSLRKENCELKARNIEDLPYPTQIISREDIKGKLQLHDGRFVTPEEFIELSKNQAPLPPCDDTILIKNPVTGALEWSAEKKKQYGIKEPELSPDFVVNVPVTPFHDESPVVPAVKMQGQVIAEKKIVVTEYKPVSQHAVGLDGIKKAMETELQAQKDHPEVYSKEAYLKNKDFKKKKLRK